MKPLAITLLLFSVFQIWGQTAELIFHSGFEPDTKDTTNGIASDIFGIDNSVSPPNNWINDLDNHPDIGDFDIQYQGGNSLMRLAEIVPDPVNPQNHVLEFWLKQPNVDGKKGRVQANIYNNKNIFNLSYSIRLFLPRDFDTLKFITSEIKWLTLMEFWNNPAWAQDYGFRITVNLQKIGLTPDSLRLGVHGQTFDTVSNLWVNVWDTTNLSFVVQVSRWMTFQINYIEGNQSTGRFYLSVEPEGKPKTVVFDITDFTHHPLDPSPDGLSHFNPFKLYTSASLINGLTNSGRLLHVYWDDFELWKNQVITGISDKNEIYNNFTLYPNPANKGASLTFKNPTQETHTIILYDLQGRIVKTINGIISNRVFIERDNLVNGMYFFRISKGENVVAKGKLIFN
jgi:Secretion system C-terminal sorting domain